MKLKNKILLGILGVVFFSGSLIPVSMAQTEPGQASVEKYVYGELVVKFRPGADEARVFTKTKTKAVKKVGKIGTTKVKLNDGSKLQETLAVFKSDPAVEYVQPNYYYELTYSPNDPSYGSQWALSTIGAAQAWDTTTGSSSVTIAVVDTGVDADHPDLVANLVSGFNTITGTTDTNDDYGHGTHVAGIAAGVINNGAGIAGLAGTSKIMPVKAMGGPLGTGTDTDIAEGIIWAADHGAQVINLSLGADVYSQQMKDAVDYAINLGSIVVAAAGNKGTSALHYPAAYPETIAVAATNQTDTRATFSNYGAHIDLSAPGDVILSATFDGSYGLKSGTSMATPYVSGLAALLLSRDPSLTALQVEDIMKRSAVDLGTAGKDNYFGYGRINAAQAMVTAPDTTPIAITGLKGSPLVFAPKGTNLYTIAFTLAEKGLVTTKMYNSANSLVATLASGVAKNSGANTITWNGKNASGVLVADGQYTCTIEVADSAGNISQANLVFTVDGTGPSITGQAVGLPVFNPPSDIIDNIQFSVNETAQISVTVLSGTTVVRTLTTKVMEASGAKAVPWDGRNNAGVLVDNGSYIFKLEAADLAGNQAVPVTGTVTVNKGAPQVLDSNVSLAYFAPKGTNTDLISFNLVENAK
ncbi:MAG TPA: S8 family serine peptidase, partial [Bacillota bacterium]|nr:S8 family serine peptidase [Bacillota bacterium]